MQYHSTSRTLSISSPGKRCLLGGVSRRCLHAAQLSRTARIAGWVVDFELPLLAKAQLRCFPGKNGIAGKPASKPSAYDGFAEFARPIIIKKFK